MPRAKLAKIKIKSRMDARIFLTYAPKKTVRNLIALTIYKPRDARQLSKVLGISLREAEKLIKKYVERGFLDAYRFHKWIILGVNNALRTEIINGLSAIINFVKRKKNVPAFTLINIIAKDILKFKEDVNDFPVTTDEERPPWTRYIFHELLARLDEMDIEEDYSSE